MYKALDDQTLPLSARVALADAALEYANALVVQGMNTEAILHCEEARKRFLSAASDVRICVRAQQFGMV
jgi:hypothetical protein